jgi:nucleotide-binding universal stress UspA family protein
MTPNPLRLLVPLDGTPDAENILPALMPLLRMQKVRPLLLGVAPGQESLPALELYLTRLRTALLVDGIPSEIKAEWGDPGEEILRAGKAGRFDLIAMMTHGRSGLHRELVGSVAEMVLRRSEIPVLTLRPGAKIGDWKRMVVALDGSAEAEAVLADAAEFARTLGATLHIVRVVRPQNAKPRLTIHPGDAFPVPDEALPAYLDEIAKGMAGKGLLALAETREGEPVEEILAAARETGAGLLCITTHGRTGLSRQLLGSVAESVLRSAPCPVLLRRTVAAAVHQAPAL